ncbi:MAG: M1 family metallopeptidase [Pseudomonadota bacterium]
MHPLFKRVSAMAFALLSIAAQAESRFSFASTPGKLPKNVVPLEYKIHIVPDLVALTFSGTEEITIDVRSPARKIVLNANQIEIDAASLNGQGAEQQSLQPQLDKEQQTLTFSLPRPLATGRYTLSLRYRGVINRSAQGLYYDRYKVGADEKIMLGSNLEATDARSFFPSWDEPVFRARFQMTADVPASFTAISNMPVQQEQTLPNGWKRFSFGMTPTMSTYLVVLAAGELERSSAMQDGTEIGVVTTVGKQASATYALRASQDLVHYFNHYFGVPYPLHKLDHIAVPGGFGGAMENWGGIIYNETTMLYDPARSPLSTQQRVFSTVAHETAHQWFGNLVTMAWWDNLWLNEAFASWMENKATAHFNPQWHFGLMANDTRESAMALDALKSSHPIYQPVNNESEAAEAFDSITYDKGQIFVGMLEAYLGEEAFRSGIRNYMAKHQYSNTTSIDLWEALSGASGKPVAKIAQDWTLQTGFPLVSVDAVCEKGHRKITLRQQQYLQDHSHSHRLWSVPVQIGHVDGKPDYVLLQKRRQTVSRPGCTEPLVIDPQSVGYYRVQYSAPLLAHLTQNLSQMPDSARVKVMTDAGVLFGDSRLSAAAYFDLVKALGDEPRVAVWKLVLDRLQSLDELARDDAQRPQLRAAVRHLATTIAGPKLAQLGWEGVAGESVDRVQLRTALLGLLADMGDPAVVAEARARFVRYLAAPQSLEPALRGVVVRTVGRYADQATYDTLLDLARKAEGTEDKDRFYTAAFSVLDPQLAQQAMPLALSKEVPPLVASRVLMRLSQAHMALVWAFAQQHADALLKMQPDYARNEFFPSLVWHTSDPAYADALQFFVKTHHAADAQIAAQRSAEGVRLRAQRKARLLPHLARWLSV